MAEEQLEAAEEQLSALEAKVLNLESGIKLRDEQILELKAKSNASPLSGDDDVEDAASMRLLVSKLEAKLKVST